MRAVVAVFALVVLAPQAMTQGPQPTPPPTRKENVVEDHFGIKIADPYRWLEVGELPETKEWIAAQNKVTYDYLRAIPEWARMRKRMEELYTFERYGVPEKVGNHLVYTYNSGLQNQSVYYISDLDGKNARVLLDPNTYSKEGTVAISGISYSLDGHLMVYGIAKAGSDWTDLHVRELATGKDLPDVIEWTKFGGGAWNHNATGFYYSAYDKPKESEALQAVNSYQKIYYHVLGQPQSQDELIFEDKNSPEYFQTGFVTEDGRYLIISQSHGTRPETRVYIKDLRKRFAKIEPLFDKFDAEYGFIGNDGSRLYFLTDNAAPNKRIIEVDLQKPAPEHWRTIVPESKENISGVSLSGNTLIVSMLENAHTAVARYRLDGSRLTDVELPGIGSAGGFGGLRGDKKTYFAFSGYTTPGTIYSLDVNSGKVKEYRRPKLTFNPDDFETTQVFYTSKDGTKVPMFLSHKKGIMLDGQNPTLLYGYGGFNIATTPSFSVRQLLWMELGGVYAVANIRGGSEYGKAWYDGGRLKNKQNVFDDFIAAAEFLIADKITSTPKLAIEGGSNGGLLVGACETQRPDLFGVCLPHVGVMDMLRFHKFTVGFGWKSDYGDPDVEEDFKTILKYSPLHNIKPGTVYPPTLVFTSDHDDRVVPAHSFKFGATLQAAQAGAAPILIRIETSGGHGAGLPISKALDREADTLAFLIKNLGITLPLQSR